MRWKSLVITASSIVHAFGPGVVFADAPLDGAEIEPSPLFITATANLGGYAPGGFGSVAFRLGWRSVFAEAVTGLGGAGPESGFGLGIVMYEERAPTARLGWATGRAYLIADVTWAHPTGEGPASDKLPELVGGPGSYVFLWAAVGLDLRLDSKLYLFTELGATSLLRFDPDGSGAPGTYDPPDDLASIGVRGGVGVHF
jgi:hypothetical protein